MLIKVAYWMNGLGEECSSRVRSAFEDQGFEYVVVHDWRSRELIVKRVDDCIAVRMESVR
jgi:hypothetical protein